jgi:hypothetical protein
MRTPQEIVSRLRREYQEMPGLSLTAEQVQRLCGIEPVMCKAVLGVLVRDRFLHSAAGGQYRRPVVGRRKSSAA